jgi:hypothetical protein
MCKKAVLVLCLAASLAGCQDEGTGGDPTDSIITGGPNSVALKGFYVGPSYALFFSDDGDVAFVTRWKGLIEEFDFAAAKAADPDNFGRWRTSGGKLFIDWGSGGKWVARLVSADELQLESGRKNGTGTFIRRPPAVAPTVTGRFRRGNFSYFGVDSTGTAAGSVSSDHSITFNTDGTVLVYDETGVFLNGEYLSDVTRLVGDYSIDGFLLTITESNGKVTKHDLWVKEGTPENPRLIVYGGSVYLGGP